MTAVPKRPRAPTNGNIYDLLTEILGELSALKAIVGEENDRGTGGSGLAGKLARVSTEVAGLTGLKQQALGAIGAVTLLGFIIMLGLKTWVGQWFGGGNVG